MVKRVGLRESWYWGVCFRGFCLFLSQSTDLQSKSSGRPRTALAVAMKRKRSDIEDQLEQENATLREQIAATDEKIQKLEKQLDLAESRYSHNFSGGESFTEAGANPHLLNRALERVNATSSTFTKLLMQALKNGGVDCTGVAKTLANTVRFERDAHTKFWYQALVCKVLFADIENEYFNVEENAPENLDPEQLAKENYGRYNQLVAIENPEALAFEDARDNHDFRRLCNKKRKDLVVALSKTRALGIANVEVLVFGEVFGPEGIQRREFAASRFHDKMASGFVRFALSVFLVHKLAFALHPVARISRVRDGVSFSTKYMEPVVASAESEDDNDGLVSLNVAFMVIPGFHVNQIVVHSKVYTGKRS